MVSKGVGGGGAVLGGQGRGRGVRQIRDDTKTRITEKKNSLRIIVQCEHVDPIRSFNIVKPDRLISCCRLAIVTIGWVWGPFMICRHYVWSTSHYPMGWAHKLII